MGLLDLHAPEFEAAAGNARISPAPQTPAYSTWDLTTAIPRGVGAGVAEMGASLVDIASGLALGMKRLRDATPEQMRAYDKAGTLNVAEDFQSDFGRAMRDEAKRWMPDPMTTHSSAQVVAEFARMLGKVAATAPFVGPVASAGIVGLEEGFTASDKLAQEGVDFNTRTNVGALTAGVTAATFALPVAGKTVGQTVGLALGGGPAAYIGQQAATRAILKDADYSQLADRYDPFDPVGLALSTLLPLGFGAWGLRAAGKAKAKADAKAAAKAESDFMAGPIPSEKSAISRAVDLQMEDAARVSLLQEVSDKARLTPADDLAGAAAHDAAMTRAIEQISNRERVDVSDIVDPLETYTTVYHGSPHKFDAFDSSKIGTGEGAQAYGHGLYLADSPAVAKDYAEKLSSAGLAKHTLAQNSGQVDDAIAAASRSVQNYQALIANGGGGDMRRANGMLSLAQKKLADLQAIKAGTLDEAGYLYKVDIPDSAIAKMIEWDKPLSQQAHVVKDALGDAEKFATVGDYIRSRMSDSHSSELFADDMRKVGIPGVKYLDGGSRGAGSGTSNYVIFPGNEHLLRITERNGTPFEQFVAKVDKAAKEDAAAARNAEKQAGATQTAEPAKPRPPINAESSREQSEGLARAAVDLEAVNPDMPVRIDGMDKAMPLSEFMARVREEAAKDLEQAPLVEVAANCALRAGL